MNAKNLKEIIDQRIREERYKRNLTLEELSEMVDISPSFLGLVERGRKFPSVENLYKLSNVLGVDPGLLFKDREIKTEPKDDYLGFILSNMEEEDLLIMINIMKLMKKYKDAQTK